VSTATAVKLINSITGCVNHGKLSRHDIIRSVFALLVGDVEVVQEDELLVRLCSQISFDARALRSILPLHRLSSKCSGSMQSPSTWPTC
jgi:hypothetical protein